MVSKSYYDSCMIAEQLAIDSANYEDLDESLFESRKQLLSDITLFKFQLDYGNPDSSTFVEYYGNMKNSYLVLEYNLFEFNVALDLKTELRNRVRVCFNMFKNIKSDRQVLLNPNLPYEFIRVLNRLYKESFEISFDIDNNELNALEFMEGFVNGDF